MRKNKGIVILFCCVGLCVFGMIIFWGGNTSVRNKQGKSDSDTKKETVSEEKISDRPVDTMEITDSSEKKQADEKKNSDVQGSDNLGATDGGEVSEFDNKKDSKEEADSKEHINEKPEDITALETEEANENLTAGEDIELPIVPVE